MKLTLQIHFDEAWHDAAQVSLPDPERGSHGVSRLRYETDYAPMRADPEGVTRTTQWGPPLEAGGEYDWYAVAKSLSDLMEPEQLMEALRQLACDLEGLDERLALRGVPSRILDMPTVGLRTLSTRFKRWGLL